MIPATPVPNTKDTNPLVATEDYARITNDTTTTGDALDDAIEDALDMFQRATRRTLLYAQYTERLYVNPRGMVYPTACPIDVSKPVVNPASPGTPSQNVGNIQGVGIYVGWYIGLPSLPVFTSVVPPQADVTYWGGYTGPAGSGPYLPSRYLRAICRIAWFIANPSALPDIPGGVKSVSVAGVSISGDLSSMVAVDPQLRSDIERCRRRSARGWGAQVTT